MNTESFSLTKHMEAYNRIKRYFLKKENRFKLATLLVLLLTLPAAVILIQRTIQMFSGAAGNNANVYILPATSNVTGTRTFQVMVDPQGDPVGFVSLDLNFDRTKVQLSSDPVSSGVLATTVDLTTANNANSSGVINVDLALKFDQTAPTQAFELINVTFQPVSGVGNNVQTNLSLANVQVANQQTETYMTSTTTGSTLTLNPVTATATPTAGSVSLNLASIPVNIYANSNFSFAVALDPNGFSVVGTDLVLNYDASKIRINSATAASGKFDKVVNQSINNTTGEYKVSLLVDTGTAPVTTSGNILTLNATALTSGSANISISNQTVAAATGPAGQNLTVNTDIETINILAATASPTATATATATATSTPTQSPGSFRNEDINMDGVVSILDYTILFQFYGQTNPSNARADINRDGKVNVKDYALLYQAFE